MYLQTTFVGMHVKNMMRYAYIYNNIYMRNSSEGCTDFIDRPFPLGIVQADFGKFVGLQE